MYRGAKDINHTVLVYLKEVPRRDYRERVRSKSMEGFPYNLEGIRGEAGSRAEETVLGRRSMERRSSAEECFGY